jgi:hypothetical protein
MALQPARGEFLSEIHDLQKKIAFSARSGTYLQKCVRDTINEHELLVSCACILERAGGLSFMPLARGLY